MLRPATDGDDHVLGSLVRLAVTDQLAARVVLQRLLPGISTMARRRTGRGRSYHSVLDEVVATAWTVIRTYPVDRRHTYVAVGLLREIDYQSFRRARRRLTTFVPRPLHTFDAQPAPVGAIGPAEELRELLEAAAAAGLDPADIELARRLGRGETTREIAQSTNVTDRTVRNKRDAVTYRLRARGPGDGLSCAGQTVSLINHARWSIIGGTQRSMTSNIARCASAGLPHGSAKFSSPGIAYGSQRRSNCNCSGST